MSEVITHEDGSATITIKLTPEENTALGLEVSPFVDWFDSALWTLVMLRTGATYRRGEALPATLSDWGIAINDLDHRLSPRIEAIRDAAIRAHQKAGGTLVQLGTAMDVPRSTAQYRRESLNTKGPSTFEKWATGDLKH